MRKHIWTSLAIALAILTWASGLQTLSGNLLAGKVMLLSALACRSANKRRLMEVNSGNKRIIFEISLIVIIILLVVLQNGLMDLMATDPVPNFVIPVISLMFYALAFYKARNIKKIEEVTEQNRDIG
jgi:hypothetical protein